MELHGALCKEFCEMMKTYSTTDLIKAIDTEKFYNIFTTFETDHKICSYYRDVIIINSRSHHKFLLHVINTRKIAQFNYDLLDYAAFLLKDADNIIRFFSFYNDAEIIAIFTQSCDINCIYYDPLLTNIKYTFILKCIRQNNYTLFIYVLNRMNGYNLSCMHKSVQYCAAHSFSILIKNKYHFYTSLKAHEFDIIYQRSLRYAWINACVKPFAS